MPVTVDTLRGFSFTGFATNDDVLTVEIPSSFQVLSRTERDKGIRVSTESHSQIIVHGLNYERFTSDGFLAIPCGLMPKNENEYEYYAVTYDSGTGTNYVVMVGCEDDTLLQIDSDQVGLNQLETYYWESSSVTGTRIISNKPLAVFVGSRCTNVPQNQGYCDHLIEQVPPTSTWGKKFLCSSFPSRTSGDIFRFITARAFTTVTVNCSTLDDVLSYTLIFPGSWREFSTPPMSFCTIVSDKPILVMQFALGHELDGAGDPFMMMITPTDQYRNNYIFKIFPEFQTNVLSVYVTPNNFQPHGIFVDDANLDDHTWNEVYENSEICGYITHVNLSSGIHRLYHADAKATIGVSTYGFNYANSYGYPGGLNLDKYDQIRKKGMVHYNAKI